MGAGLLLFLIAVSATPTDKPNTKDSRILAIRCVFQSGSRMEVGIEMRSPGTSNWVRSAVGDQISFVAPNDNKSGAEAWIILLTPTAGIWEFRPYLIDFPKSTDESTFVKLEVYGHTVLHQDGPIDVRALRFTGDYGSIVKVRVPMQSPKSMDSIQ